VEVTLSEGVRGVISSISVSPEQREATVAGREIEAETPRELRRILSESIYSVFHAGLPDGHVPARLRDREFESRLAAVVPHRHVAAQAVVRSESVRDADGAERVLVEREGVRFWAPATALSGADIRPGNQVGLALPAARPALSPGFFLVDGSTPRQRGRDVLRVYLHIRHVDAAVAVWKETLTFLERHAVPYRAKVLSAVEMYPRWDALVVYLDGIHSGVAPQLAEAVGDLPGIGTEVSAFAEELRPGIATAWEPSDAHAGRQALSFGQHRATVLAAALVEAVGYDPARTERLVVERLVEAGIDPEFPARNHRP
jgi:hypothetical protein